MRMVNSRLLVLSFCLWQAVLGAAGESKLVWQIGQPDRSYAEFALAGQYGAFANRFGGQAVLFQAGVSDASQSWPFIQPGPVDAWAGGREHPFTIRFTLPEAPRGLFT